MRRPLQLIASTCSLQMSTRVTLRPPSVRRPPNRLPMAPPPTITTFGVSNPMASSDRSRLRLRSAQEGAHFRVLHLLAEISLDHAAVVLNRDRRTFGDFL